jgi:hypothetical protein
VKETVVKETVVKETVVKETVVKETVVKETVVKGILHNHSSIIRSHNQSISQSFTHTIIS